MPPAYWAQHPAERKPINAFDQSPIKEQCQVIVKHNNQIYIALAECPSVIDEWFALDEILHGLCDQGTVEFIRSAETYYLLTKFTSTNTCDDGDNQTVGVVERARKETSLLYKSNGTRGWNELIHRVKRVGKDPVDYYNEQHQPIRESLIHLMYSLT